MTATLASGPRIQTVTADCGVTAWLVEDRNLPVIAFDFAFLNGTSHDPSGKAGALNLVSGLLDEGAGDMDAEAFQNALADHAIELSFSTDRDDFRGSLKTLSSNRAEAFNLLALAVQKPRFDDDAVGRVKAQVSAGLRRELQDPDSIARRAFSDRAFAGHAYAAQPRGTLDSVAAATVADLRTLAGMVFDPSNLHVVAVGDIGAAELGSAIDQVFGPLARRAALLEVPETRVQGLGEVKIIEMDVPQTALRYGAPGLLRDDPDYIAAEIVNHVLGGSAFTSRLFMEVREKRGLAYGVSSGLVTMRRAAMHIGVTATKNDRVAESLDVMRAEMRSLATLGPTESELSEAKDYLVGSFPLRFDTSSKIASQLLSFAIMDLGIDYISRRNDLFRAVSMTDAKRVAERLYGEGRQLVVAVGQPVGLS
ncbi:MAG: M16 family metallopeptidase [Bosea sp. (in: a-proteobacteria)]